MNLDLTLSEIIAIEAETTTRCREKRPLSDSLIIRIGEGLLVAIKENKTQIEINEEECWSLRDLIDIRIREGREQIGLAIKTKIYKLLSDFALEKSFDISLSNIEEKVFDKSLIKDTTPPHATEASYDTDKEVEDADTSASKESNESPRGDTREEDESRYSMPKPEGDGEA